MNEKQAGVEGIMYYGFHLCVVITWKVITQ